MCQRCLETKMSCKKPAHFFNREKHKKEKAALVVVVASKGSGIFYSLFFHFHVLKTSFAKFFQIPLEQGSQTDISRAVHQPVMMFKMCKKTTLR
jgi:hypothetical protein